MNYTTAQGPSWHPSRLLRLSYAQPKTEFNFFPDVPHYGKGRADVTFVIGWAIVFGLLREVLMRGVFSPFMRNWLLRGEKRSRAAHSKRKTAAQSKEVTSNGNGHAVGNGAVAGAKDLRRRGDANGTNQSQQKAVAGPSYPKPMTRRERLREKQVTRFAEQGWSFTYYAVYWAFGCYIHYNAPYYPFNLDHLWIGMPETHTPIPGPVKFYYLTQLAFWFTQFITLHVEERRKDHYQMLSHHVITTILIIVSYVHDCTRVGSLILVLLDFCDILLPLAKMLKYMKLEPLPDIVFTLFLVSWLITRQGFYSLVTLSVIRDVPRLLGFEKPGHGLGWNAYLTCSILLSALAVLLLIWLVMIARVAAGVLMGKPADDVRSDEEGSDTDEGS